MAKTSGLSSSFPQMLARALPTSLSLSPRATALDRYGLQKAGFTHVLNAAHGRWTVDTGPDYYRDMAIEYHGVEADDLPTFDLSVFFYPAAAFIDAALRYDHSKRPSPSRGPAPARGHLEAPPPAHGPALVGRTICMLKVSSLLNFCPSRVAGNVGSPGVSEPHLAVLLLLGFGLSCH